MQSLKQVWAAAQRDLSAKRKQKQESERSRRRQLRFRYNIERISAIIAEILLHVYRNLNSRFHHGKLA